MKIIINTTQEIYDNEKIWLITQMWKLLPAYWKCN